jgi:hypothetical protein
MEMPGTNDLNTGDLEEYELTLNNMDGVDEYDNLMETQFEERTIYTTARSLEEATDKFAAFFDQLVATHGYNGVKPMSLWLFQRIQDGVRI